MPAANGSCGWRCSRTCPNPDPPRTAAAVGGELVTPASTRIRLLRLAFAAALVAIFVLALLPAPDAAKFFSWQDKLEHFLLFAALAGLGLLAWSSRPRSVAGGILVYGAAMELAQSMTAYRVGDYQDWIADALGVATAVAVFRLRRVRG